MHTFSVIIDYLDRIADPFGGAKRDRTADLLHAMQALSQLSYSPYKTNFAKRIVYNFSFV